MRSTVRALFRAGDPAKRGKPDRLAFVRARGGWFGPDNKAPAVPRDERVIGEEDEDRYVAALERNGFAGPDSWYMNAESNIAYAERARPNWRLTMPVLFLHGDGERPRAERCAGVSEDVGEAWAGEWAGEREGEENKGVGRCCVAKSEM